MFVVDFLQEFGLVLLILALDLGKIVSKQSPGEGFEFFCLFCYPLNGGMLT